MILAFLPNLVFLMLLIAAVYVFTRNILKLNGTSTWVKILLERTNPLSDGKIWH